MNKKLMAVAVAGALGVPAAAFAQTSNYELYGRANVGVDQYSATGAPVATNDLKSRARVFDNASRLGVRGTENLGGGMRAFFQIESGANIDSGTCSGQSGTSATGNTCGNTSTGFLASRDSYVGVGGNWGDVRFGRQAIWYGNGDIVQIGVNYINAEIGWLNGAGFGRLAAPATRTSNVISYNSPTVNGFNGQIYYVPNSEAAPAPNVFSVTGSTDARIQGLMLRYSGPVKAQFDHGLNVAAEPAGATTNRLKITGDKLGVAYPYAPGGQIGIVYTRLKNEDAAAVTNFSTLHDKLEAKSTTLVWEHVFGNIQAMAAVGRIAKATGCGTAANCDNTGTKGYTLGARYLMSKRTAVYASISKVTNESNAISDIAGAGQSSAGVTTLPTASAGADPQITAIGIIHNF